MIYVVIAGEYKDVVLSDEEKERLTAEVIAAMQREAELAEMQKPEPTPEERLESVEKRTDDLESNSAEMLEALDMLLSGVTE